MRSKLKSAFNQTLKTLVMISPMLLAVIGLIGLFKTYITPEMLHTLFNGSVLHDMLMGVGLGGLSVGQPFLSYIIGGELLDEGASFYGVTAFILAFVTLGVVQLPLEFAIFGFRFALLRNLLSLLFAFVLSWAIAFTLGAFS
ncbi:permease [Sulfurovum riftiae]|uniref:Permease n=1 Tax=Sulfurovum riftiae TaxID=1630136 RepID=A0A151CIB4_9BACT|nr:permease [Sulfurovum riftiae]KYJ87261.1 permease [Sulfurovum riftiae]